MFAALGTYGGYVAVFYPNYVTGSGPGTLPVNSKWLVNLTSFVWSDGGCYKLMPGGALLRLDCDYTAAGSMFVVPVLCMH